MTIKSNYQGKVELRQATAADPDYLYKIFRAAMKDYITQTRRDWDENLEETQFRQQLNLAASKIIRVNKSDVGFITVLVREASVWIQTICIDPEHQNKGIGTEVVKSLIAQAQEQRLPL
jgi:N-acetylglutamate synthase-like GNAT family acetyltransferase